jgi:hypothetical protein
VTPLHPARKVRVEATNIEKTRRSPVGLSLCQVSDAEAGRLRLHLPLAPYSWKGWLFMPRLACQQASTGNNNRPATRLDNNTQQAYHGCTSTGDWREEPPGLIDRAAAILALSPPIYDYVVMSHEGPTPVAPVGPGSPDTWRAFSVACRGASMSRLHEDFASSSRLFHRL